MRSELKGHSMKFVLNEGLTANNVSMFNEQIEKYFTNTQDYDEVVLDLNHTENVDSVGVTFVIGLYKRVKSEEKSFKISGASDDIQSLFKLMKLDQFFTLEN